MVKVFKTDVKNTQLAENIQTELSRLIPGSSVTIDLEDCDKVLRVQANRVCSTTVMGVLEKKKVKGEIMNW